VKLLKRLLGALAVLCAGAFALDAAVIHVRMRTGGAFGSIEVRRYWEIPSKGNKFEYSFDPPQAQTCVHALFPHMGYSPCWYLSRHRLQRVATAEPPAPGLPASLN